MAKKEITIANTQDTPISEIMSKTEKYGTPKWRKNGSLSFCKRPIRFNRVSFDKILLVGKYKCDDDIMELCKDYRAKNSAYIPVALNNGVLIYGYESYLLAKKNNIKKMPFVKTTARKNRNDKDGVIIVKPAYQPIFNRVCPITTTGRTVYVTRNNQSKIQKMKRMCNMMGYKLVITDNFSFSVTTTAGNIIFGETGMNKAYQFLKEKYYNY